MADWIQWGSEWLGSRRIDWLAQTITYIHKSVAGEPQVTIADASPGNTNRQMEDAYGIGIAVHIRDWLFHVDRLAVVDDKIQLPVQGDEVIWTPAGSDEQAIFTVEKPENGGPVFRWHDRYQTQLRVHVQLLMFPDGLDIVEE